MGASACSSTSGQGGASKRRTAEKEVATERTGVEQQVAVDADHPPPPDDCGIYIGTASEIFQFLAKVKLKRSKTDEFGRIKTLSRTCAGINFRKVSCLFGNL